METTELTEVKESKKSPILNKEKEESDMATKPKKKTVDSSRIKQKKGNLVWEANLHKLTKQERLYFGIMSAHRYGGGLLFLTSSPGIGKSAILENIAKKLEIGYIGVHLASVDETEIGAFPNKDVMKTKDADGKDIELMVVKHIPPYWAAKANTMPCILHLEEINRCSKGVRNAVLQIINERQISSFFKFTDNVFMCSTGNLDDDDTEEMGKALKGRLVHLEHELNLEQWIEAYAKDNVHETIIDYLRNDPDALYPDIDHDKREANQISYPSHRTWTTLSNYIVTELCNGCLDNEGDGLMTNAKIDALEQVARAYIGEHAMSYIVWLRDNLEFTVFDIIEDYDKWKSKVEGLGRNKVQSLMDKLLNNGFVVENTTPKTFANLVSFLKMKSSDGQPLFAQDQLQSYLMAMFFERGESFNMDKFFEERPDVYEALETKFEKALEGIKNALGSI